MAEGMSAAVKGSSVTVMLTDGGVLVINDFAERRLVATADSRLGGSSLETGVWGV